MLRTEILDSYKKILVSGIACCLDNDLPGETSTVIFLAS
jgi:hypothetical protein